MRPVSLQRDALTGCALPPILIDSQTSTILLVPLRTQYQHYGQRKDLDEAIDLCNKSLDALIDKHPRIYSISSNLGHLFLNAYSQTHEPIYLDKGLAAFRVAVACEAAPVSERFQTAKLWAHYADSESRSESALDAYQTAIDLLPRLAMLGMDLQARHQALTSGSDGLARDAAACAILSGQYYKAIELLEEGRAVFWSQALQLRSPMTDLHEVAPELEAKLRHISVTLEEALLRDTSRNMSDSQQKVMLMEKEASYCRNLNDEWLATLEEVRKLDGFQDFLGQSRFSTLQHAAANGPVVILNASNSACAALILTSSSTVVKHVPLPNLHFPEVTKLVKLVRHAIAPNGRDALLAKSKCTSVEDLIQDMLFSNALQSLRLPLERHIGRASDISTHSDDIFRYVLGVLWQSVVEPVITSLNLKVNCFLDHEWLG